MSVARLTVYIIVVLRWVGWVIRGARWSAMNGH